MERLASQPQSAYAGMRLGQHLLAPYLLGHGPIVSLLVIFI